jgi:hypothetical protein
LIERDEQHCLLLYVHICILETTLCLIYPCEQMEGIVNKIVKHYHDFGLHLTDDLCKFSYRIRIPIPILILI